MYTYSITFIIMIDDDTVDNDKYRYENKNKITCICILKYTNSYCFRY